MMSTAFAKECEHVLSFNDTLNELKNAKFDLAITEVFDGCSLG